MSPTRRLIGALLPYRLGYAASLGASFLASVMDGLTLVLLIPLLRTLFGTAGSLGQAGATRLEAFINWLVAPIIRGVTPGTAAVRILGLLLLAMVLKNALAYVAALLRVLIEEGVVRDLRGAVFDHILRLDLNYFQTTKQGLVIAALLSDVEDMKTVVSTSLARLFQNAFLILVSLVALTQISLRLTAVTVAAAPVLVLGIRQLLKRLRQHARDRAEERGDLTATVAERVAAIKLIRAYGEEEREGRDFRRQSNSYRKKVIRTQRFLLVMSPVSELFGGAVLVLLILAGTRPEIVGTSLGPEVVVVFLVAALRMMSPIKQLSQFPAELGIALAGADRVYRLLDLPPTDIDLPHERPARFESSITYEHVRFRYGTDTPVLHDVSFVVPKGRVVAIVGPSGAGKTTLVDLLPRFRDPTEGRVLLDGTPLTELTRSSIRSLLGVVSQETVLLNDTVYANIRIGDQRAEPKSVERAAQAANAHEFILGLPHGYDTLLGERGTRLSGGQRQRIAIARALLRDPPILILDEATSALDTHSERLVQQAIDRLMKDRTVLVIAHRLATVRHADEILVLEDGRLVEQGSHEALYAAAGVYRHLYDLQFRTDEIVAEAAGAAEGGAGPPR